MVFILYLPNQKAEKGVSLIQTLIAFTIVILLVTSIIPSIIIVKKHQDVLKQRLTAANKLHDILIKEISTNDSVNQTGENDLFQFKIFYKKELIEVCGTWTNIKNERENRCYYGKKEET